jgi:DNA polymerase-3 subunit alpha
MSWIKQYLSGFKKIEDNLYEIEGLGKCLVLSDTFNGEPKTFIVDDDLRPILDEEDKEIYDREDVRYIVFKFGSNWWYADKIEIFEKFRLKPLKYLGRKKDYQFPHLGIHGEFELMNGCRSYDKWCKKAKFLGINTLGICEQNTLAGVFKFQKACKKAGIKPVIGAQYAFSSGIRSESTVKFFVKDKTGWKNLLSLNSIVKFGENNLLEFNDLIEHSEGLVCVINPVDFAFDRTMLVNLNKAFKRNFYWQMTSCSFKNNSKDKEYLENLRMFNNSVYPPVLIDDSYYLEPEEMSLKNDLNTAANMTKDNSFENTRHFKTLDEIMCILEPLFHENDFVPFIEKCLANTESVGQFCNFEIETGNRHLPKYKPKNKWEKSFENNEELLYALCEIGMNEKELYENPEYIERLEYELEIIISCHIQDYFLILWDIVKWAESKGIMIGFGRGSAAGALVSFLLGLTKTDPLKYNLLFERFLTKDRAMKSLPDIDLDFMSERKNEVKKYMRNRYGEEHVCSIGTYTTLQIKAGIKDFARVRSLPVEYINKINKTLDLEIDTCWENLIENASDKPSVKEFIQQNTDIVENIQLCQGQPKSESVHPCGTIILPDDMILYHSFPVRLGVVKEEQLIVSEWEGEELDEVGYLKEDILGIIELDRAKMIIDLVKKNRGIDIDLYDLPFEDEVFEMFKLGLNQCVFQFNTRIFTGYCRELEPENFEDLALMIAICRPGPMNAGTHNSLVKVKRGEIAIKKRPGLDEITKDTYGFLVYQEQIMKACVEMSGISLTESDDIRKALGKKKLDVLMKFEDRFVDGGIKNGYEEEYLKELWKEFIGFSEYSFNRSHAVVYAMLGYACQYLKWAYPLEFWTTAFSKSNPDDYEGYVDEIKRTESVLLHGVDINISDRNFIGDFKNNKIYWSLSVKQCGDVAMTEILKERSENGQFFSFKEFLSRVPKAKVNKAVVENLIYSGAFDSLAEIPNRNPKFRIKLINELKEFVGKNGDFTKINKAIEEGLTDCQWWWLLMQKKMSEYAFFDYAKIISENPEWKNPYLSLETLLNDKIKMDYGDFARHTVAGIIKEIDVKTTKNNDEFCRILIEDNYNSTWFYLRGFNIWAKNKDYILTAKVGDMLIASGNPQHNKFMRQNVVQCCQNSSFEILSID